ncbi:hypothetical protein [Clostridium sp. HBUAS56017]|uniref:hypothetical protein n=1 Tax=Clostridium sp. HBUAS56017 TaxID=2571128 RepID=UPI0011789B73|nr:hypothetical protein [Clostridium sp. HBUAS56017]
MSGIKIDISQLTEKFANMEQKAEIGSRLFAESAKTKLIQEAKDNAPWTDRTGLSRNTIDGEVSSTLTITKIEIRGNTPQFKYLEFCNEKKWAILWPTINKNMNIVLNGWTKFLGK